MQAKVKKWGNSLAVRIPKAIANQLSLENENNVDITSNDGQITIRPSKRSLANMLELITDENTPQPEWDDSDIQGKETW